MKNCNHCKIEKPFTEFYKHKKRKDGHGDWCIKCNLKYSNRRDVFTKRCFASMKSSHKQKRNWNKECLHRTERNRHKRRTIQDT